MIGFARHASAAGSANGGERIVVNLAAGHDRNLLVEQIDEAAQDAALRLTAQAEQDEVVVRQDAPGAPGLRRRGECPGPSTTS